MSLQRQIIALAWEKHPHEAARAVEGLEPRVTAQMLAALDAPTAGRALAALAPHVAAAVLVELDDRRRADCVGNMAPAVGAQILRRVPKEQRQAVLEGLNKNARRRLSPMLKPSQASASALADPNVLVLFEDTAIRSVLESHRDALIRSVYDIPVQDSNHQLVGVVAPSELLQSEESTTVGAIMRRDFPTLAAGAGLNQIAQAPGWRSTHSIPVVQASGELVGLLRYETLRWVENQIDAGRPREATSTSRALGDLFAAAVGGVLEAIVATSDRDEREHRDGR